MLEPWYALEVLIDALDTIIKVKIFGFRTILTIFIGLTAGRLGIKFIDFRRFFRHLVWAFRDTPG